MSGLGSFQRKVSHIVVCVVLVLHLNEIYSQGKTIHHHHCCYGFSLLVSNSSPYWLQLLLSKSTSAQLKRSNSPLVSVFSKASSSSLNSNSNNNGNNNNNDYNNNIFGKNEPRNVATQILQGIGPGISRQQLDLYNIPPERAIEEWTINRVLKINSNVPQYRMDCKSDTELFVDTFTVSFPRLSSRDGLGIELLEIASTEKVDNTIGLGILIVSGIVPGGAADAGGVGFVTNTNSNYKSDSSDIIRIGDILSSVSIVRKRLRRNINDNNNDSLGTDNKSRNVVVEEVEEVYTVSTECLGYDSTVSAIQTLLLEKAPPCTRTNEDEDAYVIEDTFLVSLKRIRRKPKVTIKLQLPPQQGSEKTTITTTIVREQQKQPNSINDTKNNYKTENVYELYAGENLRQGMLLRGIVLNDDTVQRFDTKFSGNCGANGLCRTCTVTIVRGSELLNPMRPAEQQIINAMTASSSVSAAGTLGAQRLSCKTIVGYGMKEGEIVVRVHPNKW